MVEALLHRHLGSVARPRRLRSTALRALLAALALACVGMAQALTVRYGGDRNFAPFESLDASGRPHGFQIDLLSEMAAVDPTAGGNPVPIGVPEVRKMFVASIEGRLG